MKNKTHMLLIRVQDFTKEIIKTNDGKTLIPTKWEECDSISLGSIKNPNKKIFEIKLIPL